MGLFRRPADPLAPGPLRCAYCVDDYLAWLRDRPDGKEAPQPGQALTVLPSAGGEPGAGAAVCLVHLRALMRFRHTDRRAEPPPYRPREDLIGRMEQGQKPPKPGAPPQRVMPRAASA
jgi:hypothetical protein